MTGATCDRDGDTLSVRLTDAPCARQECLDDVRIVDYPEARAVVGVEFIGASGGVDLAGVPLAERVGALTEEGGHPFKVFA